MASEVGDVRGKRLRFESSSYSSMSDLATQLADSVGRQLGCDEVLVTIGRHDRIHTGHFTQGGEALAESPIFEVVNGAAAFRGQSWSLPFVVKDLQRARVPNDLSLELAVRKVRSYGAFPLIGIRKRSSHSRSSLKRWPRLTPRESRRPAVEAMSRARSRAASTRAWRSMETF
jgi:hypothetical protein